MRSHESSRVQMLIECPKCHKKMVLHIGLVPDTTNNVLECPNGQNTLVPLVPGPIIGGPFSMDS
jgi:hypothetical protein